MKSILIFLLISASYITVLCGPIKQSYEYLASCQVCHPTDSNKINVHLIPHSHDDVGWLKTVDQYYFGSHNEIQKAGVQYIISSTVEALKENPDRRFVQVETAFFWKWWQHQPEDIKQDFIDLVNSGQIEIINAAWSMNDEAAVNYHSTVDQFTWGLRTINDTIGSCGIPRIGWQIDPFGHSREQASIFAQLGYDGVFFARLDYQDKNTRIQNKDMEVIWKGSANLDGTNIFTNMFPEFYYPPNGYCFDIECEDEVINDDEASPDYNLPNRAEDFVSHMKTLAAYYRTNNLIIPMGGDFHYQSAEKNFANSDKLINVLKNNEEINVIYSTPSCYIKAVNEAATNNNIDFTLKTDDFFPYSSDEHSYWAGYFTSRPNAKRFARVAHNILQASKQLTAFLKVNGEDRDQELTALKQAVGILQHHDAITGTAKQAVAKDYARLLTRGIKLTESLLNNVVTDLLKKDVSSNIDLNFQTCLLTNVSICEISKAERFLVAIYNPLERAATHYVRIPVPDGSYIVTGPDGEEIFDLVDSISDFSYINDIPETPNPKELVFAAKSVPAFGIKLYYVQRSLTRSIKVGLPSRSSYGTENTGFEIDDDTGLLKSVTLNGQKIEITQEFLYYNGANGDNNNRASGAYIFRPKENNATPVATSKVTVTATTGNIVDEVLQQFSDSVTQIIRVYKGDEVNYIEFDWLVGPIEVDENSGTGREIITRFTINNFDNAETFYTDSNGREMIKRVLNKRYDYEYDSTVEPIASNYYPVTSKIVVKDENQNLEVAILNDRAQGASSLHNGEIELMVHRRLLRDDGFGVDEALNDQEFDQGVVARGQFYLTFGSSASNTEGGKSTAAQERELALQKLLQPVMIVGDATSNDLSLENIQSLLNFQFSGLKTNLPDNIHILSFEPWKDDTYLLRLEHILEQDEDDNLSKPAVLDVEGLFSLFDITEIKETTLGANQWLDEFEAEVKYDWNIQGGFKAINKKRTSPLRDDQFNVTLSAMQIRTFIINVTKAMKTQ